MIKFNQFKLFILILGLSSIGSGISNSKTHDANNSNIEKSVDSESNKQLAPNFQLYDAEGKLFQLSDYQGQVIVLTFIQNVKSKKVGTFWMKENRKWLESIQNKHQDEILICGIKEMTDIPKMIPKVVIRSTLRKEKFRFLIDWDGSVFNKYPLNNLFTLLVIDLDGQISYELSEEFSTKNFDKLCSKINILMNSTSDKE